MDRYPKFSAKMSGVVYHNEDLSRWSDGVYRSGRWSVQINDGMIVKLERRNSKGRLLKICLYEQSWMDKNRNSQRLRIRKLYGDDGSLAVERPKN